MHSERRALATAGFPEPGFVSRALFPTAFLLIVARLESPLRLPSCSPVCVMCSAGTCVSAKLCSELGALPEVLRAGVGACACARNPSCKKLAWVRIGAARSSSSPVFRRVSSRWCLGGGGLPLRPAFLGSSRFFFRLGRSASRLPETRCGVRDARSFRSPVPSAARSIGFCPRGARFSPRSLAITSARRPLIDGGNCRAELALRGSQPHLGLRLRSVLPLHWENAGADFGSLLLERRRP